MNDYREIAYSRYDYGTALDYQKFANAYRRRLIGKLRPAMDWRCLDIACGYGNFLGFLRNAGVRDFWGVDAVESAVGVARKEFGEGRVFCVDIFKFLQEADNTYDLVSILDFIEHVNKNEIFELLKLVGKVQQSGNLLLLRTPNANGLFGMAARYNDITHEICFTTTSIADVLARTGYKTLAIWEDTGRPSSPVQAAHWIVWQSARLVVRLINAAETGSWGDGVLTRNMWVLAEKGEQENS